MADVYDALTMERPYKPALEREDALAVMQAETRRGWRDPNLMASFENLHHAAVLTAANSITRLQPDVDSIRESLIKLSRKLAFDGGTGPGPRDRGQRPPAARRQPAPVLQSDGQVEMAEALVREKNEILDEIHSRSQRLIGG
jgi:hypothetical protein